MAVVLHASARRSNKGRFCRAEAFIRNNNAANRLTASWSAIKKQENEKNVGHPEVCSGVSLSGLRVVELNVLAEALDGGCEACGVALRLSDCIKETVSGLGSLLYICCSNSECGETNICRTNKTHRFRCLSSSLRSSSLPHNRVRYQNFNFINIQKNTNGNDRHTLVHSINFTTLCVI